ncbi:MAG TPA: hypothetical protein O0X90_06195, partial [Methanocorpusculum sp.]|nr:hypothetical protein [Methanocorpusculum sp.]
MSTTCFTAAEVSADDAELFSEFVFGDCPAVYVFGKSADEFFDIIIKDDAVSPFAGKILGYGGWS